jgi:transcriptional regulator with XRE-family HTH domain
VVHSNRTERKNQNSKIFWTLFVHFEKSFYIWTNIDQMATVKNITSFGEHLRNLRESQSLTLKNVAEKISIDTSLLAKIERNERQPTKQIIKQVAEFFKCNEQELLNNFLSDQIAYKIMDEEADIEILKVAEEKVKYLKTVNNGK